MQKDIAKDLHVHIETLKNWEKGIGVPSVKQLPKIIKFLGYCPEPTPQTVAGRISLARRQLGLTQKQFAKLIGADVVTLYRWEKALCFPAKRSILLLKKLCPAIITHP